MYDVGPVTLFLAAMIFAVSSANGEERAAVLERLVRQDCGSCHGMTLKGGLGPDLRPERLTETPAEALALVILDGRPGTPMPPWRGLLSEADALWIAGYLKGGAQK
jgi:cytochrome c55X